MDTMEYIVSFNIVKTIIRPDGNVTDKIINPNGMPILFKSVTNTSIKEEFTNNEDLYTLLKGLGVFTYVNYSNTQLAIIKYSPNTSIYDEEIISIQDLFELSTINDEDIDISIKSVEFLIKQIYYRAQGKDKDFVGDTEKDIKTMVKYLRKIYPKDFDNEKLIESIDSALTNKYKYNENNTAFIQEKYKKFFEKIELFT